MANYTLIISVIPSYLEYLGSFYIHYIQIAPNVSAITGKGQEP